LRTAAGLPPSLAKGGVRIIRPRDAAEVYAQPWPEFKRLADLGVLRKLATGYYAIVPVGRVGDATWQPSLEDVALGIASADYGANACALMGISAARRHGAIPRASGVAVIAAPKQRPRLVTLAGEIAWIKREVPELDLERTQTEFGPGWVTTTEQTMLDLAARPKLGGLPATDLAATIRGLAGRADTAHLTRLAMAQHKPRALHYLLILTGETDA
jgi:hypothetical protein